MPTDLRICSKCKGAGLTRDKRATYGVRPCVSCCGKGGFEPFPPPDDGNDWKDDDWELGEFGDS